MFPIGQNSQKGGIIKKSLIIIGILIAAIAVLWFISIPIKKNWAQKYHDQGVEYFKTENDRQAILEFQKSNLLYKTTENYYYLGQLYFFNNNLGRAEYYFKKALSKDENYAQAAFGLSKIYLYQEKPEKAQEVVQNNRNTELGAIALSRIYLSQHNGLKAMEAIANLNSDLGKAYQVKVDIFKFEDPENINLVLSSIVPRQNEERTILPQIPSKEEVEILKDALSNIAKVSNPATRKVILAESLNQTGDAEVALSILKEIAKNNPQYRDAKVFLGHSYILIKNYEQAKESLIAAKELDPVYSLTWQYLAISYQELGDENSYKDCLDKYEKLK